MEYDEDKVTDVILALLYLNSFDDHGLIRGLDIIRLAGLGYAPCQRFYQQSEE